MVVELDGAAHLEGLYVRRRVQGQGLGSLLLEAAACAATDHGYAFMTVSTYEQVSFNAPWYRQRGFRNLAASDFGPKLQALVCEEREGGLDEGAPRVILARRLG
jgi:GNAT superfamily N-acetyltransferase